jgi:hypothetical protein
MAMLNLVLGGEVPVLAWRHAGNGFDRRTEHLS